MKEKIETPFPNIYNIPILVGIVFIVLKLFMVVDWLWLWVLSPFWIPICFGTLGLIIYKLFNYGRN